MRVPDLRLWYDNKCGLGHVMRCRTLERAWNRLGGSCKHGPSYRSGDIVVFDGYYFTNEQKHQVMQDGNIVVSYAEFAEPVVSNIIINQNLGAETYHYPFADVQLLGVEYFHLRDELKSLVPTSGTEVFDCDSVNRSLSPLDFSVRMANAKAVICASGLTAYESIYLGKPTLLRMVAENQKLTHTMLLKRGWAYPATADNIARAYVGFAFEAPSPKTLVDGNGADRVAKQILEYWKAGRPA